MKQHYHISLSFFQKKIWNDQQYVLVFVLCTFKTAPAWKVTSYIEETEKKFHLLQQSGQKCQSLTSFWKTMVTKTDDSIYIFLWNWIVTCIWHFTHNISSWHKKGKMLRLWLSRITHKAQIIWKYPSAHLWEEEESMWRWQTVWCSHVRRDPTQFQQGVPNDVAGDWIFTCLFTCKGHAGSIMCVCVSY